MQASQPEPNEGSAPRHIAVIMDGNGRWAAARKLPRIAGHRQGAEAVRRCVRGCISQGVRYLTLYAFSSENWKRPVDEVDSLMGLLRIYIRQEIRELEENGVRLSFIGDLAQMPDDIRDLIAEAESTTADNDTLILTIALNYGSHAEILGSVRTIAAQVAAGELLPDDITEQTLAHHLYTGDLPDPDLVIRTSGEQRLSNFLLWQSAYAELLFLDEYWPEFTEQTLADAVEDFRSRERRFGARS